MEKSKSVENLDKNLENSEKILQKLILVSVNVHMWRGRYQVKNAEISVEKSQLDNKIVTSPRWKLLPEEWSEKFTKIESSVRGLVSHYGVSLPLRGVDAIPRSQITLFFDKINEFKEQLNDLTDKFCDAWPDILENIKDKIPPAQWEKIKDKIPSTGEEMRAKFYIDTHVIPVNNASLAILKGEDADYYVNEINEAAKKFITDTAKGIAENFYLEIDLAIEHTLNLLQNNDNPRIKNKTLDSLKEVFNKIDNFEFLTSDKIKEKIEKARKMIDSLDAQSLNTAIKNGNSIVANQLTEALGSISMQIHEDLNKIEKEIQLNSDLLSGRSNRKIVM